MLANTVLIISSDHVGWAALRVILARMRNIHIVGDVADLRQAAGLIATASPDVIVTEVVVAGIEVLPFLTDLRRERNFQSKLIVFAARYETLQVRNSLEGGIVGYLLWGDLSTAVLGHCLAALIGGDIVLGSRAVVLDFLAAPGGPQPDVPTLTVPERAVLQLLADGLTNRAIGGRVGLSERSVERLVAGLERKLGAANKFVLAVRATRLGLIR